MLEYLHDLESDFSVFHRVDDVRSMQAPRFFQLAVRVPAYQGVMQARLAAQQHDQSPAPSTTRPPGRGHKTTPNREVAPTRAAIGADPLLSGIVSFGSG